MLDLLDDYDGSDAARRRLVDELQARQRRIVASHGRGDRTQVERAEAEVAADPRRCIRFDADHNATVEAAGRSYRGGRFELASLAALRARAGATAPGGAALRLWILDGTGPITDIGALQATAPPGSLFQVASQFNCLEAPGPAIVPVADYLHDSTQGPRAAISAFPGTLVRHYAAPAGDGDRFVQTTDGRQLELLGAVCDPGIATVRNGYLLAAGIAQPDAFARVLEDRFDAIAIGVHDDLEVVLGANWTGSVDGSPTIAQVYTSTLAALYGDLEAGPPMTIATQLLRAAYFGTLLAAAVGDARRVVLTLIGGGAFGNPIGLIWSSIQWALDQVKPVLRRDLVVVINGRTLGELDPAALRTAARARGGDVIFDRPRRPVEIAA